jgi:hypothetical protein
MKNNLSMRISEKNVHQKRVGGSVAQPPRHPGTSSAKAAMAHQESEWHPALGEANVLERRPIEYPVPAQADPPQGPALQDG